MSKFLVVYETFEGQTEKIAETMAIELSCNGDSVDLYRPSGSEESPPLDLYDAVVIGGPVHTSKFPTPLRKWVRSHAASLFGKPTAFYSVCLGILEKENAKAIAAEREIVQKFFNSTGWYSPRWTIFHGGLAYNKYGPLTKYLLRAIAKTAGGSTDTTRDHEYTDWKEVAAFAREFGAFVKNNSALYGQPQLEN